MRRTTAALLPCAIVLTCASAAGAAEPAGTPMFNVMGPSSCAGWPKRGRIESASKAVFLNWILGFVSGQADRTDPRLFELIDPDKVGAWLDSYCQTNPSASLPSAGRALTAELTAQLPPLAPPQAESAPMFVPPLAKAPAAAEPARQPAPTQRVAARKPVAPKHPAAHAKAAVAAAPRAKPVPVAAPPAPAPALRPALPRAAQPAPAPPRPPAARPAPPRPANPFRWPFFAPRPQSN